MEHGLDIPSVLLFLAVVVATVPLARALGVSPVLGYLLAGAALGPSGLGILEPTPAIASLAEIGVLFLLFSIGLELSIDRLRQLRRWVLGLGVAQVVASALVLGGLTALLTGSAATAVIVGSSLALSSTAVVLQLLREGGELRRRHGRAALGVLLLQDLAVVPLLVIVPVVAEGGDGIASALGTAAARAAGAIAAILVIGRVLLRPLYAAVAATRHAEVLLALTLLVAIGTGWATARIGLSATLGAFLAGVLVAETAYRHQVEADFEPFRGLLLGLFFVWVGETLDLRVAFERPAMLLACAAGVIAAKALVLYPLARAFGFSDGRAARIALTLSQAGEFGFVSIGLAVGAGALGRETASLLFAVIGLSMFLTPALVSLARRLEASLERAPAGTGEEALAETALDLEGHVVIAGCGRVGHTVACVLGEQGIPTIGLDTDPVRVEELRRHGLAVFVGDAARPGVLAAAGIERAGAAVVTVDASEPAERICIALREARAELPIAARARTRAHGARLLAAGATRVVAEALEGSLELAGQALESLDVPLDEIERVVEAIRADDYAKLDGWDVPPAADPEEAAAPPASGSARAASRRAGPPPR